MKTVRERLQVFEYAYRRPEGAFTRSDYQQWFNLSPNKAYRRLRVLIQQGKVRAGGSEKQRWYVLEEDYVPNGSVPAADKSLGSGKR